MKWMESPSWQFVGIVIAVVALFASFSPESPFTRYILIIIAFISLFIPVFGAYYSKALQLTGKARSSYIIGVVSSVLGGIFLVLVCILYFSRVYRESCEALIDEGEYALAVDECGFAVAINPFNADNFLALGNALFALEVYDEALNNYNQVVRLRPNSPLGYHGRGLVYYNTENYPLAIRNFTTSIERYNSNGKVYYLRAISYEKVGNSKKAIEDLTYAISAAEPELEALYDRSRLLKEEGSLVEAVQDIENYFDYTERQRSDTRVKEVWSELYKELGFIHYNKGDYYSAITAFSEALALLPLSDTYRNRGDAYVAVNDTEKALADYESAISADPNNSTPYYSRGLVYKNMQKLNESVADFVKYLELEEEGAFRETARSLLFDLYKTQGFGYYSEGAYKSAVSVFSLALDLKQDSDTFRNRADAYAADNDSLNAKRDYDTSLGLDPNNLAALYGRGFLFKRINNVDSAVRDLELFVQLTNNQELKRIAEEALLELKSIQGLHSSIVSVQTYSSSTGWLIGLSADSRWSREFSHPVCPLSVRHL
jgi:tetratricopeptide (TPR) repeat protein